MERVRDHSDKRRTGKENVEKDAWILHAIFLMASIWIVECEFLSTAVSLYKWSTLK